MATDTTGMIRVNHEKLIRFVSRSFEKLRVPAGKLRSQPGVLVASDLRGVDTHGVIRFNAHAWYVKWLRDGAMTAKPNIRVVTETAATALLDADNGMGFVAGHRAMELAIKKAKESGVGIVTVRNSRHYGMSAYYSMLALPHDMIGIAMTNAQPASGTDLRPRSALRHQSDLLRRAGKGRKTFRPRHGDHHRGGWQIGVSDSPGQAGSHGLGIERKSRTDDGPQSGTAGAPFVAARRVA